MVFQDSAYFLGIALVTLIGFVLKALYSKNIESRNVSESPLAKLVAETIFLVLLTIMWLIILFKQ